MKSRLSKIHIGLRTIKTAIAVVLAMIIVEVFGTTDSKLIFAMLGAMAAVQPTFKESLESCISQVIGVVFGAVCGVILLLFRMPSLVSIGIGIILIITLYNVLQIHYSPSLPCFILVTLCTVPESQPIIYALGRIWDTAIGLAIGMVVNMLIFPYDNSKKIRKAVYTLDRDLINFLEDLFDGDDHYPDTKEIHRTIDTFERHLAIFSNQLLFLRLKRQHHELEVFKSCDMKACALISQMEVLCAIGRPGRLNEDNRRRLAASGANITDTRPLDSVTERDVVTNYHVAQILSLRHDLLEVLKRK